MSARRRAAAPLQTFAKAEGVRPLQTFAIGPRPVVVLRKEADGRPMFWIDEQDRLCGGPNGPITSSRPTWEAFLVANPEESERRGGLQPVQTVFGRQVVKP